MSDLFIYIYKHIYLMQHLWCSLPTRFVYLFVHNGQCVATSMLHAINLNNGWMVYRWYTHTRIRFMHTKACVCLHTLYYCKSISTILNVGQIVDVTNRFGVIANEYKLFPLCYQLVYAWGVHPSLSMDYYFWSPYTSIHLSILRIVKYSTYNCC